MKIDQFLSIPFVCALMILSGTVNAETTTNTTTHHKPTMQDFAENPSVSDPYIQQTVDSMFKQDRNLNQIKVTVQKGVVTLQGNVDTENQAKNVVNAVKGISGVKEVENHLTVKGQKQDSEDTKDNNGTDQNNTN